MRPFNACQDINKLLPSSSGRRRLATLSALTFGKAGAAGARQEEERGVASAVSVPCVWLSIVGSMQSTRPLTSVTSLAIARWMRRGSEASKLSLSAIMVRQHCSNRRP